MKHLLLSLFCCTFIFSHTPAQERSPVSAQQGFIQNKGQVHDQLGRPRADVRYIFPGQSYKAILTTNGFSYEWYTPMEMQPADSLSSQFLSQRIDVEFVNASPSPTLTATQPLPGKLNFFLSGSAVTDVSTYEEVWYRDLYPGIDVRFCIREGKMKYDIIAHPGADISKVELRYHGADKITLEGQQLVLATTNGSIREEIPMSYLAGNATLAQEMISVTYALKGNQIRFVIPAYDASRELVIDPGASRVWGTFYGGTNDDRIFDMKIDSQQRVILCGWSSSTANIATTGAYQTVVYGQRDAIIVRMNSAGTREWATYYGASGSEYTNGVAVDNTGNYYITGFTNSPTGMATPGAWQDSLGGDYDCYIAMFDNSGILAWATYLGGLAEDIGEDIAVDPAGGVYVVGQTRSSAGIATPGAFQATFGGGIIDAFAAHFTNSGTMRWSTYVGGIGNDFFRGVAVSAAFQVLLAGDAGSAGLSTPGSYQPSSVGTDGLLVMFDTAGTRQWASYYGGGQTDRIWSCEYDSQGNIVFGGMTSSTSGIASPGAFQAARIGTSDGFVAKLTNDGTARVWGSYLGGNVTEDVTDVKIGPGDVIYLAGMTDSYSGLASPGAFQQFGNTSSSTDYDAFAAAISPSGAKLWTTYFGHDLQDYGYAIGVDSSAYVYLAGYTQSQAYLGTPGSHQPGPGSNNTYSDGFLEKFDQPVIITGAIANPFCAGSTISVPFTATGNFGPTNTFEAILSDSLGNLVNYTVIGSVTGVTSGTITATVPTTTTGSNLYRIAVRSVDRGIFDQDNGSNIEIWPIENVWFVLPFDFCLLAHWTPLDSVSPGGQPAGGSFSGPGVDTAYIFDPSVAGVGLHNICYTYTDSHGCATQTACWQVLVYPVPVAAFSSVPPICETAAPFALTQGSPTSPGIGVYQGPGVDASGNFDPGAVGAGTYTLSYIYFDPGGCLPDTATQTITVVPAPSPVITWNGTSLSSSEATGNQWYLNGSPISGATAPAYTPAVNGSYYVITTVSGCSDTSNVIVLTNVGLPEMAGGISLEATPNPSGGQFDLTITSPAAGTFLLRVVDVTGKCILEKEYSPSASVKDRVDLSRFGSGIYLLQVYNAENQYGTLKIIVE